MRAALTVLSLAMILAWGGCKPQTPQAASPATQAKPTPAATDPEGVKWLTNLVTAQDEAKAKQGLVLVDFYADWCGPCKMLDQTTWKDPKVVQELRRFSCVKVNVDEQPALAQQYKMEGIPTVIIMKPDGTVVRQDTGYVEAAEMLARLQGLK